MFKQKKSGIYDDFGIKQKLSFLDILIEASQIDNSISDIEIREEVDAFMFEVCISVLKANHRLEFVNYF